MQLTRCLPFALASLFATGVAHADLAACIASSEQAISLRRTGKLAEARKELAVCTASSCPEEVRSDCVRRMGLVNAAMPSLVVGAKDGQGNDLLRADVIVDGTKVATSLDGRPIELDPGEHVVRVDAQGLPSSGRKLVMAEGEKARREVFVLGEVEAAPLPVPAPPPPPVTESRGWSTGRTFAVATGAAGVVGLGIGATFGALAASSWSTAESDSKTAQATCTTATPSCASQSSAQSEHSTATTDATISTVALGVGAALVVTGVLSWFLWTPHPESHPPAPSAHLVPSPIPGGAALTALGEF